MAGSRDGQRVVSTRPELVRSRVRSKLATQPPSITRKQLVGNAGRCSTSQCAAATDWSNRPRLPRPPARMLLCQDRCSTSCWQLLDKHLVQVHCRHRLVAPSAEGREEMRSTLRTTSTTTEHARQWCHKTPKTPSPPPKGRRGSARHSPLPRSSSNGWKGWLAVPLVLPGMAEWRCQARQTRCAHAVGRAESAQPMQLTHETHGMVHDHARARAGPV